jgi:hypothetical protein
MELYQPLAHILHPWSKTSATSDLLGVAKLNLGREGGGRVEPFLLGSLLSEDDVLLVQTGRLLLGAHVVLDVAGDGVLLL